MASHALLELDVLHTTCVLNAVFVIDLFQTDQILELSFFLYTLLNVLWSYWNDIIPLS